MRRFPFCCAPVVWPRDLLLEVGGWAGQLIGEDAVMIAAATTLESGWYSNTVTAHYRRHDLQITADPSPLLTASLAERDTLARARDAATKRRLYNLQLP